MKKINFSDKYGLTEAVLSGRKIMTRRIIKNKNIIARHWNPAFNADHCYYKDGGRRCQLIDADTGKIIIPQYNVGEVVAVAQCYKEICEMFVGTQDYKYIIPVKNATEKAGWANKLFVRADLMPHQIRITNVRVERLNDISESDCRAEGIISNIDPMTNLTHYMFPNWEGGYISNRAAYAALIDRISGKGTWKSNPYVFVYDFELVK